MEWKYSFVGLVVGFLVGMTGMGGGSLMTPLLILIFKFKASVAVGSDLAYSAVMKMFGALVHKKAGTVNLPLVWRLAAGSVPGSLLGVACLHGLQVRYGKISEQFLTQAIGLMLVLVAICLLIRSVDSIRERIQLPKIFPLSSNYLAVAVPIGFALGFLVGLTSVGSGAFFAVALMLVFGLTAQEMVGTDIFHAMLLTVAAAAGHFLAGDVNYSLVESLLVGAIPGVIAGSKICAYTPTRVLRPTLATVLLLSGLKILVG